MLDPELAELERLIPLLMNASSAAQRDAIRVVRTGSDDTRARALHHLAPRLASAATRITGYAVGDHQRAELTRAALRAAEPLKGALVAGAGPDELQRHLEQFELALDRLEGV